MNLESAPTAADLISTICRKGTEAASKIFEVRMNEIQQVKKTSPLLDLENQELAQKMVYVVYS
jgi:hypothetical protein